MDIGCVKLYAVKLYDNYKLYMKHFVTCQGTSKPWTNALEMLSLGFGCFCTALCYPKEWVCFEGKTVQTSLTKNKLKLRLKIGRLCENSKHPIATFQPSNIQDEHDFCWSSRPFVHLRNKLWDAEALGAYAIRPPLMESAASSVGWGLWKLITMLTIIEAQPFSLKIAEKSMIFVIL